MNTKNEKNYLHASIALYTREGDNYTWGPGVRELYILHYVIKGSGFFICDGKSYRVRCGQCFLITPGSLVRYYPDENDPWEYAWIEFYGLEANRLLSYTSLSSKDPVSPPDVSGELNRYFRLAADCFEVKELHGIRKMIGVCHLIFAKLVELCPSKARHSEKDSLIEKAKDEVEASYYREEFNVNLLAQTLNINRASLYRNFMSEFGISPARYITNLRIERACEMLASTRLPIKSVAYSVGFSDSLHFSKVFKKQLGLSPISYRKKRQSDLKKG